GYSAWIREWLFPTTQEAAIISPVNRFLVDTHGRRAGTDKSGFPFPASENNYMFSILLPDYENYIPEDVGICYSKLFDFTWKYQKKLFSDSYLNKGFREYWNSDEKIKSLLIQTKEQKIIVKPLSEILSANSRETLKEYIIRLIQKNSY
ncbi:MAG: hypothetical protein H0X02_13350, partial [Nitrosomonas sp.]|nr:hypothetical protein [Nitrosomonas sp.]